MSQKLIFKMLLDKAVYSDSAYLAVSCNRAGLHAARLYLIAENDVGDKKLEAMLATTSP
jgi:hypothetical protein